MYRRCNLCISHSIKRIYSTKNVLTSPFPSVALPQTNFVQHLLRDVSKHSKRVALVDGISGKTFLYSELLSGVRSVGSGLVKRRIKHGDVVGIYATNSTDYVFALLGALAAGASVTLCSPLSTPRELTYQLTDSKPRLLFTSPALADSSKQAANEVKSVEDIYVMEGQRSKGCQDFQSLLEDNCSADPFGTVPVDAANDVAILPYSSGTTGLPKGVMLTHLNIAVNLNQAEAVQPMTPDHTLLLVLPLFHIYATMVIMGNGLFKGAKLVVLPKFEPASYLNAIQKYKVNFLHVVPPQLLFLLHHPAVPDYDLSSIRTMMSAAAPLDRAVENAIVHKFAGPNTHFDIFQGYGLSETSPLTHMCPPSSTRKPNKSGSVGVIIPNQEVKVVSVDKEEALPANEHGHIMIRGPNIMKGYFGKAEATKQTLDADGWFSTGDIGYYDEDGYFYIVDRIKELIKVKGQQVPPAELEALLLTHPSVADCAVIGKPDTRAGELPMAFVVIEKPVTEREIQDYVAEHVSKYKRLEGGVRFVNEIPRTASGKILRRKLRDLLK